MSMLYSFLMITGTSSAFFASPITPFRKQEETINEISDNDKTDNKDFME
jgi:hypothetical protein